MKTFHVTSPSHSRNDTTSPYHQARQCGLHQYIPVGDSQQQPARDMRIGRPAVRRRGQRGNTWESEPGKNLTFSVLLRPDGLHASQQFRISQAVSLAITDTLDGFLPEGIEAKVKWPNDIYVGNRKICGILIENTLCGAAIQHSIIGIGLNINQRDFLSDAPNPVSLYQLTRKDTCINDILEGILSRILQPFTDHDTLHHRYMSSLWRGDGQYYPYSTPDGNIFQARITSVAPTGHITLSPRPPARPLTFAFKEVSAIL